MLLRLPEHARQRGMSTGCQVAAMGNRSDMSMRDLRTSSAAYCRLKAVHEREQSARHLACTDVVSQQISAGFRKASRHLNLRAFAPRHHASEITPRGITLSRAISHPLKSPNGPGQNRLGTSRPDLCRESLTTQISNRGVLNPFDKSTVDNRGCAPSQLVKNNSLLLPC
jgi:hypothetical protein